MSRREFEVFSWMYSKCNGRREIRCSAHRLALRFNLSDAQAGRLLVKMEERGFIEIHRRGMGSRANVYRLAKINLSSVILPRKKRTISYPEKNEVGLKTRQSDNNTYVRGKLGVKIRSILPERGERTQTHVQHAASRLTVLSIIPRPPNKPSRRSQSPFSHFRKVVDQPHVWHAQDLVCYYILLFRYEYGHEPAINWKIDTSKMKNLLKHFEDYTPSAPEAVKYYLRIAFAQSKRDTVPSLGWFLQGWVMDKAFGDWDREPGDYQDTDVLARVV